MSASNAGSARDTGPSADRRKRLRDADEGAVPVVSNFFPLERYFDAAEKVGCLVLSLQTA